MELTAATALPVMPVESPEFSANPDPFLEAARREHPWLARFSQGYVVHGYEACADLLADVTAHAIRHLVRHPEDGGLYHCVASGETNWHSYAKYVLSHARQAQAAIKIKATEVAPVPTSAFPTPARRPHNSRLNTTRLQTTFGLTLPHWQQGVARMLTETL